ncbi:MAG TPA: hypothetical protein VLI92_00905 [Candidatus Saccharimonadales bacterium]|nr:hypothetical protein [Candidatus Saccharimonadales bacterium]
MNLKKFGYVLIGFAILQLTACFILVTKIIPLPINLNVQQFYRATIYYNSVGVPFDFPTFIDELLIGLSGCWNLVWGADFLKHPEKRLFKVSDSVILVISIASAVYFTLRFI